MNFNNNNNNPPGGGQVPDARLEQLMQRLRQVEEQNQQLRGNIDVLTRQGGQPTQQQQQRLFDEQVERALEQKFQQMIRPIAEQVQSQQGYLYDQVDYVSFNQKYNQPKYQTYLERVEDIRRQEQLKGRWVSREEALRLVYFEDQGKKPMPENTKEAKGPHFDPYLQQYVDDKGQIVQPPGAPAQAQAPQGDDGFGAPPQQPQQFQQQPQMQQPQGFQPQQQFQQQPQQFQQQQPYGQQPQGQFGQAPNLPPANPNPSFGGMPQQQGHIGVDISSSDQDLGRFLDKYGDIPL